MTVGELSLPSGFCSSEHKTLNSLEVTLGRDSEELAEKRSVPRRVVVYVFVQRFVDSREVKKSGDIEVGGNMGERFPRNVKEGCSTLWERRRVVALVVVSMLGSLKGGRFRVLFLVGSLSGCFCGLIKHKLGGDEKFE